MSHQVESFKTAEGSSDNLITIREAAAITSYTTAYISRLAHGGEVRAVKKGRQWFLDPVSLQEFKQDIELRKNERRRKLSDERVVALHRSKRPGANKGDNLVTADVASIFNVKAFLESGIVMALLSLLLILAEAGLGDGLGS